MFTSKKILAPDDVFLGFCSEKKYNWYRERDLIIDIDEKSFKLKFEPKAKGFIEFEEYYKSEIKNICVVCGICEKENKENKENNNNSLTRFHIVPSEFKKHFPLELKVYSYHDILILCENCRFEYDIFHGDFRKKIYEEYGFNINIPNFKQIKVFVEKILKCKLDIHKNSYADKIKLYLNKDYDMDDMEKINASDVNDKTNIYNKNINICKTIVDELIKNNKIKDFENRWRNNFLDIMQPKFMPVGW